MEFSRFANKLNDVRQIADLQHNEHGEVFNKQMPKSHPARHEVH